jgi:hypothetical protein
VEEEEEQPTVQPSVQGDGDTQMGQPQGLMAQPQEGQMAQPQVLK